MMGWQPTDALMQKKIGPISQVGPSVAEKTSQMIASVLILESPLFNDLDLNFTGCKGFKC